LDALRATALRFYGGNAETSASVDGEPKRSSQAQS
jgi:hypothetical protein